MRFTPPRTKRSSPLLRGRLLRGCLLLLASALAASSIAAQQPAAAFGPPPCSSAKPAARPAQTTDLDRARQEQTDGLRDTHAVPSAEPLENFSLARYKLIEYGECTGSSGCYWADLDAQFQRAETALATALTTHRHGRRLAIVMDIDETTLTNWCEMRREEFGYIAPLYRAWETSPDAATPIPGALRLFHQAKAAGVAVFFITGRAGVPTASPSASTANTDETAATARNLETAGFHGWTGLRLRNGPELHMPTIDYKSSERRKILEQGYTIVLSVGDQWSDLLGDPQAKISVKLPNPFYFLP